MASNYDPQSDPWAVEPMSRKLRCREKSYQAARADYRDRQGWRTLLGRLKEWREPASDVDDSSVSVAVEKNGTPRSASQLSASSAGDSPSAQAHRPRILTEQDYQAWLLTQQTILSSDILSGMRTNPLSSFRSRS